MKYGWVSGSGAGRKYKVDNAGAVYAGMPMKSGSSRGYVTPYTTTSDAPLCVAAESCGAPTTDGDVEIFCYNDPTDIFRYPIINGTAAITNLWETVDFYTPAVTGQAGVGVDTHTSDSFYITYISEDLSYVEGRIDFAGAFTKS